MKRHLTATFAVTAVLVTALSGCASGAGAGDADQDDVNAQVDFWSFTGINAKGGVDDYLAQMPDANVKLTEVGAASETATALTAALAGGKVPDLVMIQGDDLPKFVESGGNFIDLHTLGGEDLGTDYLDWAVDAATTTDGAMIGVPTDIGGLGFAYRADLFASAGLPTEPTEVAEMWSTWDGFIEMGKKYTAATGKPFVDNIDTSVFYSTVNQVTEKYYSADGELVYDTNPQIEDAFDVALEAHDAGISASIPAFSSGWSPGRANGAFAVTTAPSWILKGIKNDAPATAGNWRIASIPGVGGNWGGSFIAIPARAAHPAAAWQYIETMMSPEAQVSHFAKSGTFPAAKSALTDSTVTSYTDPFYGDSTIGQIMAESVEKFPSFYNGPDTNAIGAAFQGVLGEVEIGNVASDDAWETALTNVKQAVGG